MNYSKIPTGKLSPRGKIPVGKVNKTLTFVVEYFLGHYRILSQKVIEFSQYRLSILTEISHSRCLCLLKVLLGDFAKNWFGKKILVAVFYPVKTDVFFS